MKEKITTIMHLEFFVDYVLDTFSVTSHIIGLRNEYHCSPFSAHAVARKEF